MTKIIVYRSFTQWPIHWYRLKDGWLVQFFALTIIIEKAADLPHTENSNAKTR